MSMKKWLFYIMLKNEEKYRQCDEKNKIFGTH